MGYGCVFALGLRMPLLKTREMLLFAGFFFIAFASYALYYYLITGHFKYTQAYKYPPTGYYFSYALFAGFVLWVFSDRLYAYSVKIKLNKFILFIAKNSIWVYMWHIPLIEAVHLAWYFKFPIVLLGATLITYAQVAVVTRLLEPRISNHIVRKNVHLVLTG